MIVGYERWRDNPWQWLKLLVTSSGNRPIRGILLDEEGSGCCIGNLVILSSFFLSFFFFSPRWCWAMIAGEGRRKLKSYLLFITLFLSRWARLYLYTIDFSPPRIFNLWVKLIFEIVCSRRPSILFPFFRVKLEKESKEYIYMYVYN